MKNRIFCLLVLLTGFPTFLFSQEKMGISVEPSILKSAEYKTYSAQFENENLRDQIKRFLEIHLLPQSLREFGGFEPESEIARKESNHFRFQQMFAGFPVYGSETKASWYPARSKLLVFSNVYNTQDWNLSDLQIQAKYFSEVNVDDKIVSLGYSNESESKERIVIFKIMNRPDPQLALEVTIYDPVSYKWNEILFDKNLKVLKTADLNAYKAPADSVVICRVFNPDPITTAGVEYGAAYVDNNDNEVQELNDERFWLLTIADENSGQFLLQNDWVRIREFSNPNVQPAISVQPTFDFTRGQNGFEDINAFYHLTAFRQWIDSLGFTTLSSLTVDADVHALNGNDNSMFSGSSNPPRLFFGEGGVDDAEDADVIIHEYGHAISYRAAPNTNNGNQRQALDEGVGDYFAASYSRTIDTFGWQNIFSWDGHNEYWNGRDAATAKVYPDDLENNIHLDGEIWASVLMQIWGDIGCDTTDKIVLESMFNWESQMDMSQAALLLFEADSVHYNGSHYCAIYKRLLQRGLVDDSYGLNCPLLDTTIAVDAGSDKVVCRGDAITIEVGLNAYSGFTFSWSPENGLSDPTVQNPLASPNETTDYILTVFNEEGHFNQDNITVEVIDCPSEILIKNTENFSFNRQDIFISFPKGTLGASVTVYDAIGRLLFSYTQDSPAPYVLQVSEFAPHPRGTFGYLV